MKRITVLLAEDHMVVREGFRKLLEAEDDLEVVGEAQTGRQAVEMMAKIAMDTGRPVINGVVCAQSLEQAIERCGTKAGNKGWSAAQAGVEMINLYRAMGTIKD